MRRCTSGEVFVTKGTIMLLDDISVLNHNCRVANSWYFQQPVRADCTTIQECDG